MRVEVEIHFKDYEIL